MRVGGSLLVLAVGAGGQLALAQGNAVPATSAVAERGAATIAWHSTYAQQGFHEGVTLAGTSAVVDKYFRVPAGPVSHAALRLRIDYDFAEYRYAALEIRVNGISRRVVPLKGTAASTLIDLPLAVQDVADRTPVRVTLRLSAALSDDRCFDQRVGAGFVRVAPESGLHVDFSPNAMTTIASAWSILPETTTVVLPVRGTRMTPGEFRVAWQVYAALLGDGHHVRLARGWDEAASARGQPAVVIGDAAVPGVAMATASSLDNVRVETMAGAPLLRVRGGDSASAGALLALDWRNVTTSNSLRAITARPLTGGARDGSRSFDELGVGSLEQDAVGQAEWIVPFSVRDFAGGVVPSSVMLDLIVGQSTSQLENVLHVYLNDVLVHSVRLAARGQRQRIEVALPSYLLGAQNNLRMVFQRPAESGDCRFRQGGIPVELLGTSVISTSGADTHAADFWQLGPLFRAGFRAFLPGAYLDDPMASLAFLGALSQSLPLRSLDEVVFYGTRADVSGDAPFLLVSRTAPAGLSAPITSDGRRTQLRSNDGRLLFDVEGLSSSIVQIATTRSAVGLWVLPPGNGALRAPRSLQLDRGNVAFVGDAGIELAFQSDRDRAVRVSHPDDMTWSGLYARYRYWFIAVLWVLTTVGFIYLVRQRNERRRAAG
jgi:hypothetical protein